MRLPTTACLALLAPLVHAHPGHGQPSGSHWHASDVWGFLLLAAAVALAIWWSRGDE